jgi:hypothetical protein
MSQSNLSESAAACGAAQTRGESRAPRAYWHAYRIHGLLVVCAGAVFFWTAQFAAGVQKGENKLRADTVTAGRFELIGANGKKAALLCADPRGGAELSFYDEKEVLRLGVGISDGAEPRLMLYDRAGHVRLSVALPTVSGAPTVTLHGKTSVDPQVILTADEIGASVQLYRSKGGGALSMVLAADFEKEALITLEGPGNKRAISLSATGDKQWIFLTEGTQHRVGLGLQPDGSSELHLSDRAGTVRSIMTLAPNGETTVHRLAH